MRRLAAPLIALVILSGMLAQAGPATAAPAIDAADFAAKCSTGTYMVGFDLRVTGGPGVITNDCFITVGEGVTLSFINATIVGSDPSCCYFVVGDSLRRSRIRVINSTIDVGQGLQLAAGCCGGDGEPGHPEEEGETLVINSILRGGESVEVSGATADDDGRATVRNSLIEAGPLGIRVRASVPADGGVSEVSDSILRT